MDAPPAPPSDLGALLARPEPLLALAPMLDVADGAFWGLLERHGPPDVVFTEYVRVHATSRLDEAVLRRRFEGPPGRPVVAQLIGNDVPSLVRGARVLQRLPIAGVDFNLGCPAPLVLRKRSGGGLLGHPRRVDAILGALRDAVTTRLSVKTRLGVDSADAFDDLLAIFRRHDLDLVTVHARTVADMYGPTVRHDLVARAVGALPCPVLANGNVASARAAEEVLRTTGARGVMIGRGAVRNPWIFRQVRQRLRGQPLTRPSGRGVLDYVRSLADAASATGAREAGILGRLKKLMAFLAGGVDDSGVFLREVRHAHRLEDFLRIAASWLDHDRPLDLEAHP